jgi:Short C-terminal domain
MPDKKEVAEQLKKAGYNALFPGKIASVLNDGETVLAGCGGKKVSSTYLITNKRFVTLKDFRLYYECPHQNIVKVQIADKSKNVRITGADGYTHEILLGNPKKAHEHYIDVIEKGLKSKVEHVSDFDASIPTGPESPRINVNLIENLGDKGEKLLANNLEASENIIVKLKGRFGEGFVISEKRVYILKWGFQAGHTFGGESTAYEFMNITGLQLNKHMTSGFVEILSAATQANPKLSYWGDRGKGNNATESNYAVTFNPHKQTEAFQEAVNIGRRLINKAHQGQHQHSAGGGDLDQLEKLATLKEKGIITEGEFEAKKKQLLGL